MKRDLRAVVARIAQFIGADISEEIVAKMADKSTFKANTTANYSWSTTNNPGTTDFMRRGEVGELLHSERQQRWTNCTQRNCKELDIRVYIDIVQ